MTYRPTRHDPAFAGYRVVKQAGVVPQWTVEAPDHSVVGWFDSEALAITVADATEAATGNR